MNAIVGASEVGFGIAPFGVAGAGTPPAHGGVVIVSPGIDNFSNGTMRQINMRAFVAEAKLQNRHTGNLQAIAQGINFLNRSSRGPSTQRPLTALSSPPGISQN